MRNATLTGVPELISLPSLTRSEERVLKLEIVERRPPPLATAQNAQQ